MFRRLIMMRHGKSAWPADALNDHVRPLNGRGRRSAAAMGVFLREMGWLPDRVILSDARRTQETLEHMGFEELARRTHLAPELYLASVYEVTAVLAKQTRVQAILLLGHEPGWSTAVRYLCGESVALKTGDAALLEAQEAMSWRRLVDAPQQFSLVQVVRSRERLAPKAAAS